MPELAEARDAARREWLAARRHEANEAFYQRLRDRYTVTIEQPEERRRVAELQSQRVAGR